LTALLFTVVREQRRSLAQVGLVATGGLALFVAAAISWRDETGLTLCCLACALIAFSMASVFEGDVTTPALLTRAALKVFDRDGCITVERILGELPDGATVASVEAFLQDLDDRGRVYWLVDEQGVVRWFLPGVAPVFARPDHEPLTRDGCT